LAALLVAVAACKDDKKSTLPKQASQSKIDASLCEEDGKRVQSFDLNHDSKMDIWYLWKGDVETCKIYDFDRDGRKDWLIAQGAGNQIQYQRGDFDFDGKFDILAVYKNGQIEEVERDSDFDGNFDVLEQYDSGGQVTAVRRDRNNDQKPDEWDEYRDTVLVSVKYDDDYDGKVDRTDDHPDSSNPAPTPPPVDPTTNPPTPTPTPSPSPSPAASPSPSPAKK
jgi:hypothetical protein